MSLTEYAGKAARVLLVPTLALGVGCSTGQKRQFESDAGQKIEIVTYNSIPSYAYLHEAHENGQLGPQIARFHLEPDRSASQMDLVTVHPYELLSVKNFPYRATVERYIRDNFPNIENDETITEATHMERRGILGIGRIEKKVTVAKPRADNNVLDVFYDGLYRGRIHFDGDYRSAPVTGIEPARIRNDTFVITRDGLRRDAVGYVEYYLRMLSDVDKLNLLPRIEKFKREVYPPATAEDTAKTVVELARVVAGAKKQ